MSYVGSDDAFVKAVQDASRRLVGLEEVDDGFVVTTSSLYPSGATVQVRTAFDGRTCYVSDMGLASHEAEMLGATPRQFRRHARLVADELGVGFDDHSFFIVQVPIDRLVGAIKIVTAATHKAAVLSDIGMAEQAERNDRELLFSRLVQVFGPEQVEKSFTISGSSGHQYKVAGRVKLSRGVLFDTATPHFNSVSGAHTKFHDISLLSDAPKTVIAIAHPKKFAPDLINLLQQSVADVIAIDDPEERYRSALEAA
jgi:hypothetical protein